MMLRSFRGHGCLINGRRIRILMIKLMPNNRVFVLENSLPYAVKILFDLICKNSFNDMRRSRPGMRVRGFLTKDRSGIEHELMPECTT